MEDNAKLQIDFWLETDGRWIAEIPAFPGVMAYGRDQDEALRKVRALALHVVAERLENAEALPDGLDQTVEKLFAAA